MPKHFGVTIPQRLVEQIEASPPELVVDAGIEWAFEQTKELFDRGAPSVHFYVMQNTRPFVAMMERLQREA